MWLTIDLHSKIPIYTQIRDQVIEGILQNNLKSGEPLPSVRQLASDLGVNMHTVNKAYNLLKQEGFIQIHRQKGATINPPKSYLANEKYFDQLKKAVKPLIVESFCRGVSKAEFLEICRVLYDNFKSKKDGG